METSVTEQILEPDLPIVDPHHHLWDRPTAHRCKHLPPSDHGFMDIIREHPALSASTSCWPT